MSEYAASGDEAAFAEIVARHGAMVYRVCLRILGSSEEAEDAAQAAFVVLVRKANSLRRIESLSAWLYGIARRVSLEAMKSRRRRKEREKEAAVIRAQRTAEETAELPDFTKELAGLPSVQREAVVLRYLEGRSQEEAAQIAGCPQGTLSQRASRGLAVLRNRLALRGQPLGAAALVGALGASAAEALPAGLTSFLLGAPGLAATGAAAGGGQALMLAEVTMKAMVWTKLKVAAAAFAAATILVGGGGAAYRLAAAESTKAAETVEIKTVGKPVLIAAEKTYCAFPDLEQLENGELLTAYFAGRNHRDGASDLRIRRSKDHGATWSKPKRFVAPINAGYGVREAHLTQLQDGSILATPWVNRVTDKPSVVAVMIVKSKDNGLTWSDPIRPASPLKWQANCGKIIEISKKMLFLPLYGPKKDGGESCGFLKSTDGGKTWGDYMEVASQAKSQGMEAEMARLKNGTLVMLIRRSHASTGLRVTSNDNGKTWSKPEAVGVGHAPGLLVDGSLLLVNHRANAKKLRRSGYTNKGTVISVSLDGGKTFVASLQLSVGKRGADHAYGGIVKLPKGAPATYFTTYYAPGKANKGTAIYGRFFNVTVGRK